MKGHVTVTAVTHLEIVLYSFAANATSFHDYYLFFKYKKFSVRIRLSIKK